MSEENKEREDAASILEKLEAVGDGPEAAQLLREFTEKARAHHQLVMNRDPSLGHEEWKRLCDQARQELEEVVAKINRLT